MNVEIRRSGGRTILVVPEDLRCSSGELTRIKGNLFLLELKEDHTDQSEKFSESELYSVVGKLASIRFAERNEENVLSALDERELRILEELYKRKWISKYNSKKYGCVLININNTTYDEWKKRQKSPSFEGLSKLLEQGFGSFSEDVAKRISDQLKRRKLNRRFIGIKSFDGKVYMMRDSTFEATSKLILSFLSNFGDSDEEKISRGIKRNRTLVSGCLRILAENGAVLEKRKGVFSVV